VQRYKLFIFPQLVFQKNFPQPQFKHKLLYGWMLKLILALCLTLSNKDDLLQGYIKNGSVELLLSDFELVFHIIS